VQCEPRPPRLLLAIRCIDAQIAHGDIFHNDRHPDLKADYVLANPPFNDSDWRGPLLKDDQRWTGSRTMTRGFDA
jgi:type I restriction enzyme M protein